MKNLIKSLALVGILTAVGVTVGSAQLTLNLSDATVTGSDTTPNCGTDSGHYCNEWNRGTTVVTAGGSGTSAVAQSRYYSACAFKTKATANAGGGQFSSTTDYNINFSVNALAGAQYQLQIDQSRQGFMNVINNQTSGTATCGGVSGDLNGDGLGGALAMGAPGTIGSGSVGISQTATASRTGVTGTGGAQSYTLHFTWTQSAASAGSLGYDGGDAAVQLGYPGDCNGDISSDNYSVAGHNQATDGHWVTITATVTAPSAPTVGNNGPICAGATLGLTASSAFSPVTYAWIGPSGFTSSVQNPTIPNATAANSGTYSCTVTWNGHTSAAATTGVTVNALPSPPTASNGGIVCVGSTLQLYASSVAGATAYAWTGPNGFTSSSQNPTIPNATLAATGTYSVTVTVNTGCTSATAGTTYATVGDVTPPTIIAPADVNINL
jgi:hypothetical protein